MSARRKGQGVNFALPPPGNFENLYAHIILDLFFKSFTEKPAG